MTLWLPQATAIPSPGDVAGYLHQASWMLSETTDTWARFSKSVDETTVEVEVPQKITAPDYPRAVRLLLQDLSEIEKRPETTILRDIRGASLDIVRLAIAGSSTRDGRISVEGGRRVFEAARDLLLAAACSVIEPRAVFTKRKPDEAMHLLDRAKFGQTELGSFVATIECTISPRLQQTMFSDDRDPEAPFERRTTVRVANSLRAVEDASRVAAASGEYKPFHDHIPDGVSSNLCDAIAELIEATSAEAVTASVAFASRRPVPPGLPKAAAFSADIAPLLREAARNLREEATYVAFEVSGTIVKLESPDPSAGGTAVVRAVVETRMRHVRIPLGANVYQDAIKAHGDRSLVSSVGDLQRVGRDWVLQNARDFRLLSDDLP